jgi:hypothetical protein
MIKCPNRSSVEWKNLKLQVGKYIGTDDNESLELEAYKYYIANGFDIPTDIERIEQIKENKFNIRFKNLKSLNLTSQEASALENHGANFLLNAFYFDNMYYATSIPHKEIIESLYESTIQGLRYAAQESTDSKFKQRLLEIASVLEIDSQVRGKDTKDNLLLPVYYQVLTKRLTKYGLSKEVNEEDENDEEVKILEGTSKDSAQYSSALNTNTKNGFPKAVRMLMGSLDVLEKDSEGVLQPKLNEYGLFEAYSYGEVANTLLNKLQGVVPTIDNFIYELKVLGETNPVYNQLVERLGGDNPDTTDRDLMQLRRQFVNTFGKYNYDILLNIQKENGDYTITSSNQSTLEKNILKEWNGNLLARLVNNPNLKAVFTNPESKLNSLTNEVQYVKRLAGELGITTDNSLMFNPTSKYGQKYNGNSANTFNGLLKSIDSLLRKEITANPNFNIKDMSGNKDILNLLQKLAILERDNRVPEDLQVLNVEGNAVYSINLHNFQTYVISAINYFKQQFPNNPDKVKEALNEKYPGILNIYNTNSLLVNLLLNSSSTKELKLSISDGHTVENDPDSSLDTTKLKESDLFTWAINSTLKNNIIATKHADRQLFFNYSLVSNDYKIGDVDIADINLDLQHWQKKVQEIYVGYLTDEVKRSIKANTDGGFSNLFDVYNKNNQKTLLFSGFISDEVYTGIVKASEGKSDEEIKTYIRNRVSSNLKDFVNHLQAITVEQYKDVAKLNLSKGIDNTIGISSDTWDKFKQINEDEFKSLGKDKALEQLLGIAANKFFIGAVEQVKLFYGDLGFYGVKEKTEKNSKGEEVVYERIFDVVKRLNMQSSSKGICEVSDETNSEMSKMFADKRFEYSLDGGVTFENYNRVTDGSFREIVVSDVECFSRFLADIERLHGKNSPQYKNYAKLVENDGASFVNPFFMMEMMYRNGSLSKGHQNVVEKELQLLSSNYKDDKIDYQIPSNINPDKPEDIEAWMLDNFTPMPIVKPSYTGINYGMSKDEYSALPTEQKLGVRAIRKTSYDILLPSTVKGTELENVLRWMIHNKIDVLHFESAAKVGIKKKRDFYKYDTDGNTMGFNDADLQDEELGVLDFAYLGKQIEIHPFPKDKTTASSQERINLLGGIFANGKPIDFSGTKEEWNSLDEESKASNSSYYKDFKHYKDIQNQLVENNIEKLKKEFSLNPETNHIANGAEFVRVVKAAAEDRDSADNIIDALNDWLRQDGTIGNKNLKFIESLPNYKKIQYILNSLVTNRILIEKRSGTSLAQVTSTGREVIGSSRKTDKGLHESNDVLKYYTLSEDGKKVNVAEIKMPLPSNWIGGLINKYEKDSRLPRDKKRNILALMNLFNQDIKDASNPEHVEHNKYNKLLTVIGFRIPNQQLSSTDVFKIVEFTSPFYSQNVVVPSEMVTKTGSDFDIDKLNMYFRSIDLKSLKVNNDKNVEEAGSTKQYKAIQKRLENELFDAKLNLLLRPERFKQFVSPIIDDVLKQWKRQYAKTKVITVSDLLTLPTFVKQSIDNASSKPGVGIVATWITFSSVAQQADVNVEQSYTRDGDAMFPTQLPFKEYQDNYSLSNIVNTKGETFEDILSALITSQVDAVKDTYANDLGLNLQTMNVACFLALRGVDTETIINFLKNDTILDWLAYLRVVQSNVYTANKKNMSVSYDEQGNRKEFDFSKKRDAFVKFIGELTNDRLTRDKLQTLELGILNKIPETPVELLIHFYNLDEQASKMQEIKSYFSPDTNYHKDLNSYDTVMEKGSKILSGKLISPTTFFNIKNNTIKEKFFDGRDLYSSIYSQLYVTRNPMIKNALDRFKSALAYKETNDKREKIFNYVDEEFINFLIQLKTDRFKNKLNTLLSSTSKDTVGKRIIPLRKKNPFLNKIIPVLNNKDKWDNLQIKGGKMTTIEYNTVLKQALEFQERHPELFKDIIELNILQSGISNSPFQLLSILPYESTKDILESITKLDNQNIVQEITEDDLITFGEVILRANANFIPDAKNMKKKVVTLQGVTDSNGNDVVAFFPTYRAFNKTTKTYNIFNSFGDMLEPIQEGIRFKDFTKVLDNSDSVVKNYVRQIMNSETKDSEIEYEEDTVVAEQKSKEGVIPLTENFSRTSVEKDKDYLYLFTDNAKRTSGKNSLNNNSPYALKYTTSYPLNYPTMTQAVIRGLDNAFPITTMVDDNRTQWNDSQFNDYKKIIDDEINTIKKEQIKFKSIKFASQMPFGQGKISNMKQTAPKIWNYLNQKLKEIGIDNTGESPTITITPKSTQLDLFADDNTKTPAEGLNERLESYGNVKLVLSNDFYLGNRPQGRLNSFKASIAQVADNLQILANLNLNEFDFISNEDKKRLEDLKPLVREFSKININDISSSERRTVDVEKRFANLSNQIINEFVDIMNKYVEQQLGKSISSSQKPSNNNMNIIKFADPETNGATENKDCE